jgi:hypothetical protein
MQYTPRRFHNCAHECGDCGAWYTGSGHSFTDANNSIIGNTFINVRGGIWARLGLEAPAGLRVHGICE